MNKAHGIKQLSFHFYNENQSRLKDCYPGISKERLFQWMIRWEEQFHCHLNFKSSYRRYPDSFFSQLLKGIPVEYLFNDAYFFKDSFYIDDRVLIPRSETEIMVEHAIDWIEKKGQTIRLLDLGSGSGCVGLSIALNTDAISVLHLSDIDKAALEVTKKNVFLKKFLLSPKLQVNCYQADRFRGFRSDEKYTLIVSNPPYIKKTNDAQNVHWQVKKYEPPGALFIEDDRYDHWYAELFAGVREHLSSDGLFIMEGHERHLYDLERLAIVNGLSSLGIIKDYTGRPRFLKVTLKLKGY